MLQVQIIQGALDRIYLILEARVADIDDMQLAEDVHFFFGHMVMQRLCGYGI